MIKKERQFRITKNQVKRISQTLATLKECPEKANVAMHPLIAKAQEDALTSQLSELEGQFRDYESLKAGNFDLETLNVVTEVPTTLIKCRIAQGLSQKDLAELLRLKEQQIQRYEATEYSSASFARIKAVAEALGATIVNSAKPSNSQ